MKTELSFSGLLVKELAVKTGLKKHTIDNYLSVRGRMPSADVAVKIAKALGVSVEYLVTGKEIYPENTTIKPEIKELIKDLKILNREDREMVISIIQLHKKRQLHKK